MASTSFIHVKDSWVSRFVNRLRGTTELVSTMMDDVDQTCVRNGFILTPVERHGMVYQEMSRQRFHENGTNE
ncbi:hypothetical protein [Roseiconus lacunae]|uniref:hypothetical protein n=1 Tax=Roseiconus lacunae TaxID=2605694 RepID=UPI001E2AB1B5|nr:hypothetical protein [Roseiconus lacunae]